MVALCALAALLATAVAQPDPRVPTTAQLAYQKNDISMFMHFSMCTFAP